MTDSDGPARGNNKIRSACDLCRHRKIRCDRAKPSCENCALARIPCTFTSRPAEARKSVRQQLSETRSQVQALESLITRDPRSVPRPQEVPPSGSVPASRPNLHDTAHLDTALWSFQQQLENCWPGGARSPHKDTFCAVVSRHTGNHFTLDNAFEQISQSYRSQYVVTKKQQASPEWPDPLLVKQCVEYYDFKNLYSVFPVVESRVVRELLNEGILDDPGKPTRAANRACLAAFTALIATIHRHKPAFARAEPDVYIRAALATLPDLFMEEPDVRTLEAFILLVLYIHPTGQDHPADMLLAAAVRIVFQLGGHRSNPDESLRKHHSHYHLRALFWLCYFMDKKSTIRTFQEPLINDSSCDLELPPTYVPQSSTHQFLQAPLTPQILLFPSDLRLALIQSKIYNLLYSDWARAQPEARRLQHILELDKELSAMESTFPAHCQPHVFASKDSPVYAFHDLSMRGVSLHLDYYYCVKRVHEANNATSAISSLSSGMELSYQTSRCILLYVNQVSSFITWHSFWIYSQPMLSAVLSIVYHCICNPVSPGFVEDLEMLERTMNIFTSLIGNSDDPTPFPPFYITEAFIHTMIRLARQSYVKAAGMQ
ncbi:hypothetical protein BDV25DRAFT_149908 [Aspergillus avenaceus]|uniref:Zn(2)-C6 fungal-type domain-containing protein n=1 Tax=Aspergillus avenaceus TaxID=36643 RepID=A0A5N6U4U8_ASPAV|nr:hypothetical protein BDV25DRAFT_149908 [Aspergillus avenaceus]